MSTRGGGGRGGRGRPPEPRGPREPREPREPRAILPDRERRTGRAPVSGDRLTIARDPPVQSKGEPGGRNPGSDRQAQGTSGQRQGSGARRAPARRKGTSDLGPRVLAAVPAVLFALFIVTQGGLVFAVGVIALGTVALAELYRMMRRARPIDLAGYIALAALVLLALYEERADVLFALVGAFPLVFLLALARTRLDNLAWGIAATLFGLFWVGLPMAHAVLLRELPHGDGLMIDVLIATFIGDTAAYLGGRLWGRRALAPDLSPNKTVEGLAAGIVGATAAFWFAGLYQDWLTGPDALIMGFLVALAAPIGDLFESAIKRDLDVKDAGRLFGAHGGVLDRLDAVFFTVVVTFYAALALGYT